MTKDKALYSFFNRFGLPGYASTAVPDDASFPYLTYDAIFDAWGASVPLSVSLWYRTESEAVPNAKAQELADAIGTGVYIPCDGGAILLTRGSPWCQSMTDSTDPRIKRRYINITAEYLTLN